MQETYSIRQAKLRKQRENVLEEDSNDKEDKTVQTEENEQEELKTPQLKRLKSFREMNIDEKLTYLENFPKQVPLPSCFFELENKMLQGFFLKRDNEEITVNLLDQKEEIKLSIKEIKDIKLSGMSR